MAQKQQPDTPSPQTVFPDAHDILMDAPIGIFTSTPEGKFLYANQALADMYGYPAPQDLMASIQDIAAELFADPKDGPVVTGLLATDGMIKDYECEHIRKDGSRFWASGSIRTVYAEDGNVSHYQGFVTDITERKRAGDALRLSETQFRNAFEHSAIGIALVSPEGRWLEVNRRVSAFLGYTEDELMRKTFQDLTHPEDLDSDLEFVQRMLAGEIETYQMEKRYFHKDGRIVWGLLAVSLVWDDQGAPLHFISQIEDITERKQVEEALNQSNELLDATQRLAKIGGWEWDVARQTMSWTDETYRIHGLQPGEVETGSPEHIACSLACYAPDDRPVIEEAFRRCAEDGQPYDLEFPLTRVDGHRRWIRTMARPDIEDGRVVKVIGNILDITERKVATDALHESDEKHRRLFETMAQGVVYHAADGVIISANPAAERILGLTFDQMRGKTSMDPRWKMIKEDGTAVPGTDHPSMIALRTGETVGPVVRGVFHPGKNTHIWLSITAIPLFQPGEAKPFQNYATFEDITERKRAEQKLIQSELTLSNAMKMARLGHWEWDVASGMFTFSDSFYKIFQTSAEEVGGYTMSVDEYARRFVHPEDRHQVAEEAQKALEADDPNFSRYLEHRVLYADGSKGYIAVRFFIAKDETGRTVKTYGVNQDITERKKSEEALRESERRFRLFVDNAMDAF